MTRTGVVDWSRVLTRTIVDLLTRDPNLEPNRVEPEPSATVSDPAHESNQTRS
ncbi:hypothetical protein Hanom_Chr15g01407241 [Helianthus anomalus]